MSQILSSLGLSTNQEIIIGLGVAGVAAAIIYYEYEKSKAPDPNADSPPDLCKGISQFHIPWWAEVGAVIVTGGLAGAPVAAYEGCKWYEAPHLQTLEGSVRVGVFQGTYETLGAPDSLVPAWTKNCDKPIVIYKDYSYGDLANLKSQYKGREDYIINTSADLDKWKTVCQQQHDALVKAAKADEDAKRAYDNVNAQCSAEYNNAFSKGLPFPFTETYLRAKCTSAALTGAYSDLIVSAWMASKSQFDANRSTSRYNTVLSLWSSKVSTAESSATGRGVSWPAFTARSEVADLDDGLYNQLTSAELIVLSQAQSRVAAKYPPVANEDVIVSNVVSTYALTLQGEKLSRSFSAPPTYDYLLNLGLDDQHAKQAQSLTQAAYQAAVSS